MEKNEWLVTSCAFKKRPMRIVNAHFVFQDGETDYIPDGKILYNGWGEMGSTYLIGEQHKPIPQKLKITWFSFIENAFFSGTFQLPYQLISDLFKTGFISPTTDQPVTYEYIVIGVAPMGIISIWLAGEGIVTEISLFQAKTVNIDWRKLNDNPSISRRQYVEARLIEILGNDFLDYTPQKELEIDFWKRLNTKYHLNYIIFTRAPLISIWIYSHNGEREFIKLYPEVTSELKKRGIPVKLDLRWESSLGINYSSTIIFNEDEVFAAFEKLNMPLLQHELLIEINDIDQSVKLFIKNNKHILEFKYCEINVYSE